MSNDESVNELSFEVTVEDAAAVAAELNNGGSSQAHLPPRSAGNSSHSNTMAQAFNKLLSPMRSKQNTNNNPTRNTNDKRRVADNGGTTYAFEGDQTSPSSTSPSNQFPFRQRRHHRRNPSGGDNSSFNSESAGQMSVAATVASLDTIKVSNRQQLPSFSFTPRLTSKEDSKRGNQSNNEDSHENNNNNKSGGGKSTWRKLKQLVGAAGGGSGRLKISRSKSEDSSKDGKFHHHKAEAQLPPTPQRSHSTMEDLDTRKKGSPRGIAANRVRGGSVDFPSSSKNKSAVSGAVSVVASRSPEAMMDDSVRGRLDGIDLLFLGPAHQISLPRQRSLYATSTEEVMDSSTPWEPAPSFSFAGRSTDATTKDIVADMLWTSAGHQRAEIVLEGFFRDDRWTVTLDVNRPTTSHQAHSPTKRLKRVEEHLFGSEENPGSGAGGQNDNTSEQKVPQSSTKNIKRESDRSLPPLQLTEDDDEGDSATTATTSTSTQDDHSLPRHKLWSSMWGKDPPPPLKPAHMSSAEDVGRVGEILDMAASCSVPIDVDEDTFIICNPQHLQAVHDIAAVPLQHGRFNEALYIFGKILKGIEIQENDALRHLEGVTLHNMAVILMWQGKFEEALEMTRKAVKSRYQYLPPDHPDLAVSLCRQAFAYFALESFDLAIASLESALGVHSEESVTKAKILNNLGVVRYQLGDDAGALKNFTDALEIQRLWLQGPVRRETDVFGAAVMLGNMGKVHIKRGDYDLALSCYEEALLLQTSVFSKDHDLVLASLISIALAWAFNAQPLKSGQILNSVLRSQMSRFGPGTVQVVETTGTIGNLHFGLGNYEDALRCFSPVLKWQKDHLKSSHPALLKTKQCTRKLKHSIKSAWI